MRFTAVVALLLAASPTLADGKVRHAFESSVPAAAVRRIVVDIPMGDLVIRSSASKAISISGYVSREPDGARSRAKEQAIVNDTTVEIYINRDEAVVRRRFGAAAQGFRGENFSAYSLNLTVPVGVSLDFETSVGEIDLEGTFGDVDIDLRAGEIRLRTPRSAVRDLTASCRVGEVRTNIGDEIIEREGVFPGKTRFRNPSGKSIINVHTTVGEVNVDLQK